MYAKLFASVATSSLTDKVPIAFRGVFFMLIAIADKGGNVVGTDSSIARVINCPMDVFSDGVVELMKPDPESQSPDEDGRRLVRLDVPGYRIVNYKKYSGIMTDEERRAYFRVKKQLSRENAPVVEESGITPEDIYNAYPRKVGKPAALKAISKAMAKMEPTDLLSITTRFSDEWSTASSEELAYCPHPSTWFNQERYNDSPETWRNRANGEPPVKTLQDKIMDETMRALDAIE